MQHYVGLDVSVNETSVCIVDKAGKVIREVKVATEPVAILAVLTEERLALWRIGLGAGPLSEWLPVHVKTLASQKRRMLLTSRQLLQPKALDIENDLRGTLR